MDYNTQLPQMIIPEYGRNIQNMINFCITLEDRDERNRCARAIIQVMGQLNPHLRDVADFTHKLWDHLFIISEFKLDVDSPYPMPSAETLNTKPGPVDYPTGKIKYKHYGKIIEDIISKAKNYEEGPEKEELKKVIANNLKKFYITWNSKDLMSDDIIFKQMDELSGGELKMEENIQLSSANELVKRQFTSNTNSNNNRNKHNNNNNRNKHHNNNNRGKHHNNNRNNNNNNR
ncbi:MAG: hypothetical protein K0S33_4052 [Bacteroidetes bacterium]|jgi:hypothetical protein|nr:hypothetical protein [Bacteroidota bacterium]